MAIYSKSSVQNFDNWWFRKKKRIASFNKSKDDIDKIYLYAKDLSKLEYEFLIKKARRCWNKTSKGLKRIY